MCQKTTDTRHYCHGLIEAFSFLSAMLLFCDSLPFPIQGLGGGGRGETMEAGGWREWGDPYQPATRGDHFTRPHEWAGPALYASLREAQL